jgi:hypothetical protein
MRFPAIIAVLACLVSSHVQSQDCANGQCEKSVGPIRRAFQSVRENQPIRSAFRVSASDVGYSVGSMASGGSSGSMVVVRSYGSSGGGSSGSVSSGYGFGYDVDGALITSVGVPVAAATAPSSDVSTLGLFRKKTSRQAILDACQAAHAEGTLTVSQLQAIKLATRSPRMLQRMEDLIVERAQSCGAYAFTLDSKGDVVMSAINWEAIGDFILKIAPFIFKLIELFL